MKPNELIRKWRCVAGLDEQEVAGKAGLTIYQYSDLEDYEDEAFMIVPVGQMKLVCDALGVGLVELYGLETSDDGLSRNGLRDAMAGKKLSVKALSDVVGVQEESMREVMNDVSGVRSWVMDPILHLARALDIKPGDLLKAAGC